MRLREMGLLLAVAASLAACSGARPSDGEIERLVRALVGATGDDPAVEVRDFERTDGREASTARYVAEIEYTLVYLKSSEELREALGRKLGRQLEVSGDDPGSQLGSTMKTMAAGLGFFALSVSPFEKGDTKEVQATVTLERWESGWKLAN